jgi:hypothetical protein
VIMMDARLDFSVFDDRENRAVFRRSLNHV